jgi:hypothetical protein
LRDGKGFLLAVVTCCQQKAGGTTGEQRVSRDIAAGKEEKALKTGILGVDVA